MKAARARAPFMRKARDRSADCQTRPRRANKNGVRLTCSARDCTYPRKPVRLAVRHGSKQLTTLLKRSAEIGSDSDGRVTPCVRKKFAIAWLEPIWRQSARARTNAPPGAFDRKNGGEMGAKTRLANVGTSRAERSDQSRLASADSLALSEWDEEAVCEAFVEEDEPFQTT